MKSNLALKWAVFVAAISIAGPVGLADAAPSPFATSAVVTIQAPIDITESNGLSFGTITRPTTGTGTYTVSSSAPNSELVATGDGIVITAGNRGNYHLDGIDGHTYTLSATTPGSCSGSGVSLNTTLTTTLDQGTLDADVHVGGTLAVDAGADTGGHTCGYTVAANY